MKYKEARTISIGFSNILLETDCLQAKPLITESSMDESWALLYFFWGPFLHLCNNGIIMGELTCWRLLLHAISLRTKDKTKTSYHQNENPVVILLV